MKVTIDKSTVLPTNEEEYSVGQEESPIQKGDKVKVLSVWGSRVNGWNNSWINSMDNTVGKTGTVTSKGYGGVQVTFRIDGERYSYGMPYWVLEVVK